MGRLLVRIVALGRTRAAALALGASLSAMGAVAPAWGETLGEAIASAYQTNPTLQSQRASLRALDETVVQARAGYAPSASVVASIVSDQNNSAGLVQQTLPGQSTPIVPGGSQTSGAVIALTQPIYTGGRVAAQVSTAQAQVLAGREQLHATEESVLQQVVTAYADVRRDQQQLAALEHDHDVLQRELAETRARFEVGELTRTDLALVEARVAAADAQMGGFRAQLGNSRAAYAQVVGHPPGDLAPEPSLDDRLPPSLEAALALAPSSPAVLQSVFTEAASAAKLAQARANRRPTISLQATYGYAGGQIAFGSPFTHYSHDLSISGVVTQPLFTGGLTTSQVRAAAETDVADRLNIEVARRTSQFQVSQAWDDLTGSRTAMAADQMQVAAAELASRGMLEESRNGDRSVFDALLAEQSYSAAQVALIAARHDAYVAEAQLLASLGRLDVKIFAPEVKTYDPRVNFDHVRRSWPFAPWTAAVGAVDRLGAPPLPREPDPR